MDLILQRDQFGEDLNKLVEAISPNCTEFILGTIQKLRRKKMELWIVYVLTLLYSAGAV